MGFASTAIYKGRAWQKALRPACVFCDYFPSTEGSVGARVEVLQSIHKCVFLKPFVRSCAWTFINNGSGLVPWRLMKAGTAPSGGQDDRYPHRSQTGLLNPQVSWNHLWGLVTCSSDPVNLGGAWDPAFLANFQGLPKTI